MTQHPVNCSWSNMSVDDLYSLASLRPPREPFSDRPDKFAVNFIGRNACSAGAAGAAGILVKMWTEESRRWAAREDYGESGKFAFSSFHVLFPSIPMHFSSLQFTYIFSCHFFHPSTPGFCSCVALIITYHTIYDFI